MTNTPFAASPRRASDLSPNQRPPIGTSLRWDVVVVGLGYVGLPLVDEAAAAGLRVVGLDLDADRVAGLNSGLSHVDDISGARVSELLTCGFRATADAGVLADADTVVICVPTPLDADHRPDLGAVVSATEAIAARLRPGTLVVLESTTWPGTTDDLVLPILSRSGLVVGRDFHLAFSPERIDPGNPTFGLRNTPKVVGGHTQKCLERAVRFYSQLVDTLVPVRGTREAELAKLLENTYRHVNIALMNEMAIFCDELGVDLWSAIDAASTKPFGFQAFRPGPGVGGHCIPVDPNYLSHAVRRLGYPFRFVELAQEINERMPAYVVARAGRMLNAACKSVNSAKILLVGVTYKADIADERETPALPVARRLRALGADLSYHDPYVAHWRCDGLPVPRADDLAEAAAAADLVIVLTAHRTLDLTGLAANAAAVLDTRGAMPPSAHIERL